MRPAYRKSKSGTLLSKLRMASFSQPTVMIGMQSIRWVLPMNVIIFSCFSLCIIIICNGDVMIIFYQVLPIMIGLWGFQSLHKIWYKQDRSYVRYYKQQLPQANKIRQQIQIYYIRAMTFRSLDMSQYQMIIPRDSAFHTINLLGYENAIHFTDSSDASNRSFSNLVKRCEENLHKIELMIQALKKEAVKFEEYDECEPGFIDNLRKKWRDESKNLGVEEVKLLDLYEERVSEEYQRFYDLSERVQKMGTSQKQSLEKIACLEVLSSFLGDSKPKRENQDYYINNISQLSQVQSVSFIVAAVEPELEWKISKMIYRVSRGYACTKSESEFKFYGLKNFDKKVLLVIYPAGENHILEKRLMKLVSSFCENVYMDQDMHISVKTQLEETVNRYNEISSLTELGQKEYKEFLEKIGKLKYLETWRIFLWKEKLLYQTLNKLDRRQQFYIANIYLPKQSVPQISLQLARINPAPTLHEVPLENPPTAFETNTYTSVAQQITDTYGVPRYQEINPSIFTTVTFPFFFGVMFGDIAHGTMLFALGLYAIFNHQNLEKGMLQILGRMRYMLTLMGFFAIYCGFIYNDMAGFNMNFFSSCFDPPPHPHETPDSPTESRPIYPRADCIYPFGIDPVWGRAENELVFVNSLKMKISVIIAILHMTVGVCCKAANSLYFKKKLEFYFEFIPQFIFLFGLFGYMDFLIIFKWLKLWNQRVDGIPPERWAPSIIGTMMNIGLSLGRTSTVPDGTSNMWGERGNSSQDTIQLILLLIGVVCVPWMLIPKPWIEIRSHKAKSVKKNSNPLQQQNLYSESRNALQEKLNPKHDDKESEDEHSSSQIVVHQLIQTIEFVLGAISNTASYLRLWALSLAHSQLSKVFFQQTAGRFFGSQPLLEVPSLFIGSWMVIWITFAIILCMDSMECFLHSLRLHWVEFQNKFYKGDGYRYAPLCFSEEIFSKKVKEE